MQCSFLLCDVLMVKKNFFYFTFHRSLSVIRLAIPSRGKARKFWVLPKAVYACKSISCSNHADLLFTQMFSKAKFNSFKNLSLLCLILLSCFHLDLNSAPICLLQGCSCDWNRAWIWMNVWIITDEWVSNELWVLALNDTKSHKKKKIPDFLLIYWIPRLINI